jgi:hypothetical protein
MTAGFSSPLGKLCDSHPFPSSILWSTKFRNSSFITCIHACIKHSELKLRRWGDHNRKHKTWIFFLLLGRELGFEPRVSLLQSKHSIAWATPRVHFALVILEMGSPKLFAWAVTELQSSWPQPPKYPAITSMSHHPTTWAFFKLPCSYPSCVPSS